MAAVDNEPILVTGAAGFIGYHVATALLKEGRVVIGGKGLKDGIVEVKPRASKEVQKIAVGEAVQRWRDADPASPEHTAFTRLATQAG